MNWLNYFACSMKKKIINIAITYVSNTFYFRNAHFNVNLLSFQNLSRCFCISFHVKIKNLKEILTNHYDTIGRKSTWVFSLISLVGDTVKCVLSFSKTKSPFYEIKKLNLRGVKHWILNPEFLVGTLWIKFIILGIRKNHCIN